MSVKPNRKWDRWDQDQDQKQDQDQRQGQLQYAVQSLELRARFRSSHGMLAFIFEVGRFAAVMASSTVRAEKRG